MSQPSTSEKVSRFEALDGLRGYACVAVIFYHAILGLVTLRSGQLASQGIFTFKGYDIYGRAVISMFSGETAVFLFFALSGAVLIRSLEKDTSRLGLLRAMVIFPIKRVLRLMPALAACLIAMFAAYNLLHVLMPSVYAQVPVKDLVDNLKLHKFNLNGVTWTLRAEMLAVPFIMAAFVVRRYLGATGLAALLSIALVVYEKKWFPDRYEVLNRSGMYFAAGFLAYDFSQSIATRFTSATAWLALFTVIFFKPIMGESRMAAVVQLAAMMVLILCLINHADSSLGKLLRNRLSLFLGKISYSLYLVNVFFLVIILKPVLRNFGVTQPYYVERGVLMGLAITLLSIPVAILFERLFEQPFIKASSKLTSLFAKPAKPTLMVEPSLREVLIPAQSAPAANVDEPRRAA